MIDQDTQHRLEKRLDNLVDDEVEAALIKIADVVSEFISAGGLNGSRRLHAENQALRKHFNTASARMARMVYQVAGNGPAAVALLKQQTTKMAKRICDHMAASRESNQLGIAVKIQEELEQRIAEIVENVCFEFENGFVGDQTLKKDKDINITAIQNQSPGGILQTSTGDGTQNAQTNVYAPLLSALDEMMETDEFGKLDSEQQDDIRDIVDTVRKETEEPAPDSGKIQRWGKRAVKKLSEFGLNVSANAIGSILAKVIGGG